MTYRLSHLLFFSGSGGGDGDAASSGLGGGRIYGDIYGGGCGYGYGYGGHGDGFGAGHSGNSFEPEFESNVGVADFRTLVLRTFVGRLIEP